MESGVALAILVQLSLVVRNKVISTVSKIDLMFVPWAFCRRVFLAHVVSICPWRLNHIWERPPRDHHHVRRPHGAPLSKRDPETWTPVVPPAISYLQDLEKKENINAKQTFLFLRLHQFVFFDRFIRAEIAMLCFVENAAAVYSYPRLRWVWVDTVRHFLECIGKWYA